MEKSNHQFQKYFDVISQNSLKGESYYIKFKEDANIYLGIPILRTGFSQSDDGSFSFNILEPREKSGYSQKLIQDIQFFEKR